MRTYKFIFLVLFACLPTIELCAQSFKTQLNKLDSIYQIHKEAADSRIVKYLKSSKRGRVAIRHDGSIMALVDVSPGGIPIYIKSDNAGVATSLGVDELREGGSLGLNLEGNGIQVGIWDEGKIRNDHIEYIGRITQIDNPPSFNTHSSHVLGTIIASGVNANAKGMAPKATAIAFDFFNDVSEMIGQAGPGQGSIILSNHSYGTLSGWDNDGGTWTWYGDPGISQTIDWKFGFYNSTSNFYDDIAYNSPYYLIVKSAGNDNSDVGDGSKPPDCDPFDCIPTNGVAKNILTVGAVKKLTGPYTGPADVVITDFSSLGPTDDGRIKPDIVAPGQGVFSASANSASSYTILSGTSMSSPATTGALVLLQELHKNLNSGNLMKAATLKALAIHTAHEAGPSPGPDFKFGWGLLHADSAARLLIQKDDQNIFMKELSLNNGEVFEMDLEPKQDTKITATLVWTDPAGQVLSPTLNPTTKMLKNDLDLRLVDDGGTMQFPWILNSADPAAAAVKGDNIVDNVEKLEFDNPEPRVYKLKVSHKGTLVSGKQDFSLIITYTSLIDPRVTYYWIGNTGDWDNGAKWSLSSGGTPANVVPTADDKIVFDENSFSNNNQTVSLTQDQACYSIRWFANESINLSFNGQQLTVVDEVNLLSGNISSTSSGTLQFMGNSTTDAMINLNTSSLEDFSLQFLGQDAKWFMAGDFKVDKIELIEGSVTIDGNSVQVNTINSTGIALKELILNNSTITGLTSLSIDFSGISLQGEDTMIEVPIGASYNLNLGTNFFNGTIVLDGGEISVLGNGRIERAEGAGTLIINGNNIWNNIELNEGSILRIEEGMIQKIADTFSIQATAGNRVTIESSGSSLATIDFESHRKICLDNLDVTTVLVEGESVVNAGINSTLINSPNWVQDTCDNILFADFDIDYNCEEAAVFFIDKSSGPIQSRTWNFGDTGSLQNESSMVNPIHLFESIGPFEVSLEVSDGTNSQKYFKEVSLTPTVLAENKVELSNGKLISFLPATEYQWVLDGVLLDNTNVRSIDFSNGFGLYAVLTFDEDCNRQSDTFLVTGFDESQSSPQTLVYPNPAINEVYVKASRVNSIKLMTHLGQPLNVLISKVQEGYRVDVSGLPRGLYILQVGIESKVSYHRIAVR